MTLVSDVGRSLPSSQIRSGRWSNGTAMAFLQKTHRGQGSGVPAGFLRRLAAFASRLNSRYVAGRTIRARFPSRFNVDHRNPAGRYDPFAKPLLWVTIKPKYVNMTDINFSSVNRPIPADSSQVTQPPEPIWG